MQDDEIILPIAGWSHYYISNLGNVYSDKKGEMNPIKLQLDSKKRYILVNLNSNGQNKRLLVHRLVAQAFLPNPNNLSDVHHKDDNPQNNTVKNLEWCSHRENLHHSYTAYPPSRNTNACVLLKNGEPIASFQSIRAAMRYSRQLGCNAESLGKYLRCGEYSLQVEKQGRKCVDNKIHNTQNRNPIVIEENSVIIFTCRTCIEGAKFLSQYTGKPVSEKMINQAYNYKRLIFNTYTIKR